MFLLPLLGLPSIGSSSEAREAQVIDTMLRDHEFVLPLRNGLIPSKPPLFHWIGAGISSVLSDVTEFSVRLPSFLAGLITLVATYFLSLKVTTLSSGHLLNPRSVALSSVCILSLTYGFHRMMTQAMVDMVFVACFTGALAVFFSGISKNTGKFEMKEKNRIIFWCITGFAILARGPLAAVLIPFLTFFLLLPFLGLKKSFLWICFPSLGWLGMLLIGSSWYSLAYQQGGQAFIERQLVFENLKRVTGGENMNSELWWFYIPSLLRSAFPWSLVILGGLFSRACRNTVRSCAALSGLPALTAGLVLLSLASGKRHSYLLPLFPLVAHSASVFIHSWMVGFSGKAHLRFAAQQKIILCGVITLLMLLLITLELASFEFPHFDGAAKQSFGWIASNDLVFKLTVLSALLVIWVLMSQKKLTAGVWLASFVLLASINQFGLGIKHHLKGFPYAVQKIREHVPDPRKLVVVRDVYDEYFDPILFYLRSPVDLHLPDEGTLPCDTIVLSRQTHLNSRGRKECGETDVLGKFREVRSSERDLVLYGCRCLGGGTF